MVYRLSPNGRTQPDSALDPAICGDVAAGPCVGPPDGPMSSYHWPCSRAPPQTTRRNAPCRDTSNCGRPEMPQFVNQDIVEVEISRLPSSVQISCHAPSNCFQRPPYIRASLYRIGFGDSEYSSTSLVSIG